MFTSASLINSRLVSEEEKRRLIALMDAYAKTEKGKFLNYINYRNIDFYWCDEMKDSGGVMGAWLCWLGARVYLLPGNTDTPFMKVDTWCSLIAPTLVHELCHVWQYKRSWWLYILACLPIVRTYTIEKEANVVWKDAIKFFQDLENIKCVIASNERIKKWAENHVT